METSEQQRRPTIGQFAQQLKHSGLELNAVDLADIFWLAQFIESDTSARSEESVEPSAKQTSTPDIVDNTLLSSPEASVSEFPNNSSQATETEEPTFAIFSNNSSPAISQSTETEEHPQPEEKGTPISVPAAPAIRTSLDLARSLRPLMQKVPSRTRVDLDEEATVNQLAETRICVPVVRSTPERWLDLDLVVESSKTTILWERAITELQHLMEYQGAFRTVRTWRLQAQGHSVQLFPRWNERPRSIRELIDPAERRLILYVSDCTSALWRQGMIHETLWQWSEAQPLALVQMLPERLWSRTALSDGHIVRLGAMVPGLPNSRLDVEGLPDFDQWDEWDETDETSDRRRLILPIVTLDPAAFQRWARVVAGVGDTDTPGRVFEMAFVKKIADQPISPSVRTAEKRVQLFRATASRTARQLAGLMAATPVSLPVIDLLRQEFLPDAQQSHVAEVLLSGVLQRCDADKSAVCQYDFFTGVRELLLDGVPIAKTVAILDRLSEIIAQKAGRTLKSFEALLSVLQESENTLGESALPFAQVGLEVLRRLGGDYAKLADGYENLKQTPSVEPVIILEEREYEVAKIINFPALQTFEYEPAVITDILERIEFETATIARETVEKTGRFSFQRRTKNQKWVIHRRRSHTWGYTESLNDEIGLEMVLIPGGTFLMGAPESEEGSCDSERPQHHVTLSSFLMGRYPVTQAQWKAISSITDLKVEIDLDPDPSHFKDPYQGIDRWQRPVEKVNWYEAVEFCDRLSKLTGRDYRLPSEAQWEYACRGVTQPLNLELGESYPPFHFGETITTNLANYRGTDEKDFKWSGSYGRGPKGEYRRETTPVGFFKVVNSFGLSDMHGNVWEWCADDLHKNYDGAPTDGSAWIKDNEPENVKAENKPYSAKNDDNSSYSVQRGGSWFSFPLNCRSAIRNILDRRDVRYINNGFRVVCVPPSVEYVKLGEFS